MRDGTTRNKRSKNITFFSRKREPIANMINPPFVEKFLDSMKIVFSPRQ
ncbi:hypothetical protein Cabys_854 [Caldithrix abyssi DSM 13497]|uniref:Uncharacterized protein n=1 Tax=Caldithrix abyssi DSM 13497 TaxID=880073 RepID=A0A1J1C4J4_CALAY|nr:hypothetical protein Cabys_854 [Caldithrix abyssi DSM 13497]